MASLEDAIARDSLREKPIGKFVIKMTHKSYKPPMMNEGFDKIIEIEN